MVGGLRLIGGGLRFIEYAAFSHQLAYGGLISVHGPVQVWQCDCCIQTIDSWLPIN
jgi:hypothetical protein